MALSNITTLSSFTDNAPASPAYMNAKFGEIDANFQRIAATASGATSAFTAGPWVFASDMTGADWSTKVNQALALLSAGGVVDARSLSGAQTMSSHVTISTPYSTLLIGPSRVSMDVYGIVIPVGTHGVTITGAGPWASVGGTPGTGLSVLDYRGTSAAIRSGDSTAMTNQVAIGDLGILLNGSGVGTGASGIELNRVVLGGLERIRVAGLTSTNTQRLLVLDGTGGYTGFVIIENPWLGSGNVGIDFTGNGANAAIANQVLGGSISGVSTGIGIQFNAGSSANRILGTDIESMGTALSFLSTAARNLCDVRLESNTTELGFESGTGKNIVRVMSTDSTNPIVSDAGTNNGVQFSEWLVQQRNLLFLNNQNDATASFRIRAGLSSDQQGEVRFADKGNTAKWAFFKDTSNNFSVSDVSNNNLSRLYFTQTNNQINPVQAGSNQFSLTSGSGGQAFYDGNNNLGASITSNGFASFGTGSAIQPGIRFLSEQSLGFYKSADSTIASSYGTVDLSASHVKLSSTSSLIGAFVVQGSASSFTVVTWSAVKANDIVFVTPTSINGAVSSLSSGIVAHSHCTQNGQVELRLSNVSTLAQNVSSKTWYFTRITPF